MNQSTGRSSNTYVLLFGVIMLVGLLFLAWLGTPPTVTAVGEPLPQLDLQPLLHADQAVSRDDLAGKIAVIHFWGTWCPPCKLEFPEFAELAGEFLDNPQVTIVSVSSSQGPEYDVESLRQKTQEFMAEFNVPIPTYVDKSAMTRSNIGLLLPGGTFGYPTTVLVDRDGAIVEAMVGYSSGGMQKLAQRIDAML